MRICRDYARPPSEARGAVVAMGNFDGVHLGHRGVIGRAADAARALSAPLGVLAFEPHPARVLRPGAAPGRLTPFRTKVRRLRECGADYFFCPRFTRRFARKPPGAFVDEVLREGLGVRHVVVGHDYRYGHRRAGDGATLAAAGAAHGFGVTAVPAIGNAGEIYSSTRVRQYLKRGEPRLAAAILGHPWEVEARVAHGDKRGRELGFPTANLRFGESAAPAFGIYAVWAGVVEDGRTRWRPAVASCGVRPTFGGGEPLLEVHVFDFAETLYGRYLRVAFVSWLRAERRFESAGALVRQMREDGYNARFQLAGSRPPRDMGRTAFNQ